MQIATLVINGVTIVCLGAIIWASRATIKSTRATTKLIEGYRHDIDWLSARIDLLEAQRRSDKP